MTAIKAVPVEVDGVIFYPVHYDRPGGGKCPGCQASNIGSTDLSDKRCRTVSSSSDQRCYSLLWKTGEAGLAAWTADRLTR